MKLSRKDFLGGAFAAAAIGVAGGANAAVSSPNGKIRAVLLHLGFNMWGGYRAPGEPKDPNLQYVFSTCPTERKVWDAAIERMRLKGMNMAVVDLGGGMEFPSHPELTIKGSFSAQEMRDEVKRLRGMGIVAIPKLNFSTCHDGWLGPYERMISTPKYYEVVKDLIDDACEIFGNPGYVHLGLDEEDYHHQRNFPFVSIRQGELWWHDFHFYLNRLEKHGATPIVFGCGKARAMGENFYRRMPKFVIQNIGMYGSGHTLEGLQEKYRKDPSDHNKMYLDNFSLARQMSEHGMKILSCTSNWKYFRKKPKGGKDYPRNSKSIDWLHDHYAKQIVDDRLFLGGLYAPWQPLSSMCEQYTLEGIDQLASAMAEHGWGA